MNKSMNEDARSTTGADDCPGSKPHELYNKKKYPELGADFFKDKGEFYKPEPREAHQVEEPQQCPAAIEVVKEDDCDFGTDPFYAECVL